MVAVTPDVQAPAPPVVSDHDVSGRSRTIGLVPSASLLTGAVIAAVWFWIPLALLIVAVSSIPSVVGFALAGILFVYSIRGAEWVERVRSEAVFGMGIPIPPRRMSQHAGFQRWAHQLWLDVSSARFWKGAAHHYLRMSYDALAALVAVALLTYAFMGPAIATAINHSDAEVGLDGTDHHRPRYPRTDHHHAPGQVHPFGGAQPRRERGCGRH
jgi:putative sensor protein